MGDVYHEIMVKRNESKRDKKYKIGSIAAVVVCLIIGILFVPGLVLVSIIMGILVGVLLFPRFDKEYEYLYVNGGFDIDTIYARKKRKKICSYELCDLEFVTKEDSSSLKTRKFNCELRDFTSGNTDKNNRYVLVFCIDGIRKAFLVELENEIILDLKKRALEKIDPYM